MKIPPSMKDRGHKNNFQSGSLKNSEPEFLVAGKLRKSHGLKGEMWIEVLMDFPELFDREISAFIGEKYKKVAIKSFRFAGKLGLILFEGYENPESLRSFNNAYLYFESKYFPKLQNEEFYHHELIGLEVKNNLGDVVGTLTKILVIGANDVYVITPYEGNEDILIPAIESVIQKIDIESKVMIINPPEWEK